ncbi:MAG: hypothetical protein JXA20_00835 [Spirochaetes bacterium]|nr:hypothetical protein [Spirochaetota bacterium]
MRKNVATLFFLLLLASPAGAREFLNAFMHVNFGMSYGLIAGDLINYEHNANYFIWGTRVNKAGHYDLSYCLSADLIPFPPLILGNESNALKIGIRGCYRSNYIRQNLSVRLSSRYEFEFGGNLMDYRSWMAGPVFYYCPVIRSDNLEETYRAGGGFTFFILYGQIIDGRLRAYPSMRDMEIAVPIPYSTSITGYRIDVGIGAAISFCSINIGLNMFYSMLTFTEETRVYQYLERRQRLHEFCVEIYVGIPFEWSRIPLLF